MTQFKILIVADVPGWAYWKRAEALKKYAPLNFYVDIACSYKNEIIKTDYDLVFFLPFSYVEKLKSHCISVNRNPIIVTSYNVGWNYSNNWLVPVIRYSNAVIINSYEMWLKSGKIPNTYYISNGVDRTIFKPLISPEQRPFKILWCGSEFHKKVKGYDEILVPLKKKLLEKNIILDLKLTNSMSKNNLNSKQMADWYNTGSLYICTSLNEGTPNPALEAASCGCSIISTKVGNMPELIKNSYNGYLLDNRNIDAFYTYILMAQNKKNLLCNNMLETISSWDWKTRSNEFFRLFEDLINSKKNNTNNDKKNSEK